MELFSVLIVAGLNFELAIRGKLLKRGLSACFPFSFQ
jgi:hypothetical protein